MEHLALEIFDLTTDAKAGVTNLGSKYAFLPEDTSITITDTSEIFASGDVWSHSFTLNVRANAHIFGTAGEIHGSRLHEQINKRRARLWVEGLPLYLGYLKLDDEVDVDENGDVDVTFESGQKAFEEMIDGAKANQVPMMEDVLIGMALWREREVDLRLNVEVAATIKEGVQYDIAGRVSGGQTIVLPGDIHGSRSKTINVSSKDLGICSQYPQMVFPKGVFANLKGNTPNGGVPVNRLNTDFPFDDAHPYCNIALCYQKHGYPTENGVVNYSADEQLLRGYETAPANRVNSAPNFYVLYWIKALMKHLGIHIEENQMMNVEDLRRLFFVNTKCAYEVPQDFDRTGRIVDSRYGCFTTHDGADYIAEKFEGTVDVANSKLNAESWNWRSYSQSSKEYVPIAEGSWLDAVKMQVNVIAQIKYTDADKNNYVGKNRLFHYAYATSDCFPDIDVSEVLKAIENGFGVRFLFDNNYKRVRIVLLRNIFRDGGTQEIACEIIGEPTKQENNIRGFRMTYGDKKDDTTFYYKGFADKLAKANELWADNTDKHDYSHWDLHADYATLIGQISAFDKTCYVTPDNGNAYGIKIDQDAKAYEELRPSLFEYAGYMDAEDGDCTGEEETIETIELGFTPAIMNDVNFDDERSNGSIEQQFALFVSDEMRARRPDLEDKVPPASYNDSDAVYDVSKIEEEKSKLGLFSINGDMPVRATVTCENTYVNIAHDGNTYGVACQAEVLVAGYINEGYRLYLQDNFDPNDDGVSPIETHDWGLTLGIMRGSGDDAYVGYDADPDDGEGNDTWDIVPGSSATAHPDTCDSYGRLWDYNGGGSPTMHCTTPAQAIDAMQMLWPRSNFDLVNRSSSDYLISTYVRSGVVDDMGVRHTLLFARSTLAGNLHGSAQIRSYATQHLAGKSVADMYAEDRRRWGILIEVGSSNERATLVKDLQQLAFGGGGEVVIDGVDGSTNGVGVTEGRFSLKLRAEKPNPYFDATQEESEDNRRYLEITDPNLRGRGLADQFYKEYSYWVRNARIAKVQVHMELAQLLSIDKTVRVTVGDVTGFIRKIEYSISKEAGLGNATMEIMYI